MKIQPSMLDLKFARGRLTSYCLLTAAETLQLSTRMFPAWISNSDGLIEKNKLPLILSACDGLMSSTCKSLYEMRMCRAFLVGGEG